MSAQQSYNSFCGWFEDMMDSGLPARLEGEQIIIEQGGKNLVFRLPLILRQPKLDSLARIQDEIDDPSCYLIVLMQAGRASLAVGRADELVVSKQIQKYMVRMSQGKSQLTYLNQKGKSRLGSRIRLRQAEQFFEEIDERLLDWSRHYEFSQLFLSCTPKLKGAWLNSSKAPVFEKKDPRWRRVPFTVHLPSQTELQRIQYLLCSASEDKNKDEDEREDENEEI